MAPTWAGPGLLLDFPDISQEKITVRSTIEMNVIPGFILWFPKLRSKYSSAIEFWIH